MMLQNRWRRWGDRVCDEGISPYPGVRIPCGVLTCQESLETSTGSDVFGKFSSISVTKRLSIVSKAKTGNEREIPIATVTSQDPKITSIVDGIKVNGYLETERATIRVELFKEKDCQAEFICKVHGMDRRGREAVSTATLVQRSSPRRDQGDDRSMTPALSLQLLASIQQLLTKAVDALEDKIYQLKEEVNSNQITLEGKLEQFKKDIHDRSESFQRLIENRLLMFENRIEDKVDNNNNMDKLIQSDIKISTAMTQFCSEIQAGIQRSLENLLEKVQDQQGQSFGIVFERIEKTLNGTCASLASMESDFDLLKSNKQLCFASIKNETETIREILTSGDALSQKTLNNVIELQSSLHNCTTRTDSELKDFLSDAVFRESHDLWSVLKDILTPKICRKGMGFALSQNPSPYILFNSTQISFATFDFPHLCETVTDGGGWIVIQRRVKGDADFNRNWPDYKKGFGSFDGDFWLGNDKIHTISSSGTFELRIDLTYKNKTVFAHYAHFFVAGENEKYKLKIGSYQGSAGDSLGYHNGRPFSTVDRDNDASSSNCAKTHGGGWWFGVCDDSNLNGKWRHMKEGGVE
ncbi:hypothetical protein RRG08_034762 [Elysia crispata]|uniref:Fibrinogen C-terminal domain-containing protein n=1 Tax=Elysia crispata TaxID=231223 RepID=A0AAE0YAI7_9GAST|nr:hypothetical protein RRG08_034762 [Elysia crispata]